MWWQKKRRKIVLESDRSHETQRLLCGSRPAVAGAARAGISEELTFEPSPASRQSGLPGVGKPEGPAGP